MYCMCNKFHKKGDWFLRTGYAYIYSRMTLVYKVGSARVT